MENVQWLTIDQKDINKPKNKKSNGVKVQVMISPSSVPSAVRSYIDEELGKLIVEFKYLSSSERLVSEMGSNDVEFFVGKNSGKIYKVVLSCDKIASEGGRFALEMIVDAEDSLDSNNVKVNKGNKLAIENFLKSTASVNLVRA